MTLRLKPWKNGATFGKLEGIERASGSHGVPETMGSGPFFTIPVPLKQKKPP